MTTKKYMSQRAVAKALGISRNTVIKYFLYSLDIKKLMTIVKNLRLGP
ncbi:helix-turn-helix domain-containing protein [Anaerosporobacter mobilis]